MRGVGAMLAADEKFFIIFSLWPLHNHHHHHHFLFEQVLELDRVNHFSLPSLTMARVWFPFPLITPMRPFSHVSSIQINFCLHRLYILSSSVHCAHRLIKSWLIVKMIAKSPELLRLTVTPILVSCVIFDRKQIQRCILIWEKFIILLLGSAQGEEEDQRPCWLGGRPTLDCLSGLFD